MNRYRPPRLGNEKGMVLVAALMVMAMLAVLCAAGISASSLEAQIAGHDRASKQAFYLCDAGISKTKRDVLCGWGWGTGTATGMSASLYTFTFTFDDANTTQGHLFDAAATLWAAGKWQNFTFADAAGGIFNVTGNTSGAAAYTLTMTSTDPTAPQSGPGTLYYADSWHLAQITWTSGTTTQSGLAAVLSAPPLNGTALAGYFLIDAAGNAFDIQSSTSDSITVTAGAPVAGTVYTIATAKAAAGTFVLAPNRPNSLWTAADFANDTWYLLDSGGRVFRIRTATQSGGQTTLTVAAGTAGVTAPANGSFELTTNPWLSRHSTAALAAPTYAANSTSPSFRTPLGDYGSVTVATSLRDGGGFTTTATATSGAAGDARTLLMDWQIRRGGAISFTSWREPTP